MKKLALLRSIALAAAVTCSTTLIAQEGTNRSAQSTDSGRQSTQADQSTQDGDRVGGVDRTINRDNAGRGAADRGSNQTQSGINDTRQTARTGVNTTTGDATAATAGQSGQMDASTEVQKLFSGQLIEGNKAEVELGKIAQQRAENDQVKQFAQKMVTEHQSMNEKLTSLHQQPHSQSGNQSSGNTTSSRSSNQSQDSSVGRSGSQNQSGQQGRGDASTRSSQTTQSESGAHGSGHGESGVHASTAMTMQGDATLQKLTSVMSQACENKLQMTKQMLEQYKGQEFDMAYMGQQIVAHTAMLAHLKAMQEQSVGDQQFRQLVDQATRATEQHLQQAKSIAEQLKNQKS